MYSIAIDVQKTLNNCLFPLDHCSVRSLKLIFNTTLTFPKLTNSQSPVYKVHLPRPCDCLSFNPRFCMCGIASRTRRQLSTFEEMETLERLRELRMAAKWVVQITIQFCLWYTLACGMPCSSGTKSKLIHKFQSIRDIVFEKRSACLRCKSQKLQCSLERPTCDRCRKASAQHLYRPATLP